MKSAWMIAALGLASVLACSADGGDDGASPAPCETGRQLCDKACVDVESDARNCGACGAACADGQRCSAGECACDDAQALCPTSGGMRCLDITTSVTDCGACGHACQSAESCVAGTCNCIGDAIECGSACVDPRTDAKFCGATAGCGENGKGTKGTMCGDSQLCVSGACTPCLDFTLAGYVDTSPFPLGTGAGDFDGDGKMDLVVSGNGLVDILKGNGDGTFTPLQRIGSTAKPLYNFQYSIPVLDLDGDGHADFLMTGSVQDAMFNTFAVVFVFYGNGDGTFPQAPATVMRAANRNIAGLTVTDVDKDGKNDLVVGDPFMPGFAIALGTGGRGYAPWVDTVTGTGTNGPRNVLVTDLDGNGQNDILATEDGSFAGASVLDVVLKSGTGWAAAKKTTTGQRSQHLAAADLDGDGKLDVMTADGPSVTLLFGKGDGTFARTTNLLSYANSGDVIPVDLDGDKIPDLVIGGGLQQGYDNPQVEARVGIGDGRFYPPISLPGGSGNTVVIDVNGDGRLDIVTAITKQAGKLAVYLSSKREGCQ